MKTACRYLLTLTGVGLVTAFVMFVLPTPTVAFTSLRETLADGRLERAEELVVALAALALWGLLAWFTLLLTVTGAISVPGVVGRTARRVSVWGAPVAVRHAVAVLLGVSAMTGLVAMPAAAADATSPQEAPPSYSLTPDWPIDNSVPEQTPAAPAESSGAPQQTTPEPPQEGGEKPEAPVRVEHGDTLWSVAAEHLGEGATDTQIAAEWPKWWSVNREVIGEDPDLLTPGQELKPPE